MTGKASVELRAFHPQGAAVWRELCENSHVFRLEHLPGVPVNIHIFKIYHLQTHNHFKQSNLEATSEAQAIRSLCRLGFVAWTLQILKKAEHTLELSSTPTRLYNNHMCLYINAQCPVTIMMQWWRGMLRKVVTIATTKITTTVGMSEWFCLVAEVPARMTSSSYFSAVERRRTDCSGSPECGHS